MAFNHFLFPVQSRKLFDTHSNILGRQQESVQSLSSSSACVLQLEIVKHRWRHLADPELEGSKQEDTFPAPYRAYQQEPLSIHGLHPL